MKNLYLRSSFLLLLLCLLPFHKGWTQTLNWPEAEKFGLLSGSGVQSNNSILVQGSAGAINAIDPKVLATENIFGNNEGNVSEALDELQDNINYCSSLSGNTIDNNLSGQILTAGVYHINYDTYLNNEAFLELQGDSTSIFIFNIAGDLTFEVQSAMAIGNVRPGNIYWNVSGKIYLREYATAFGIFMSQIHITKSGPNFGMAGLFSLQGIDFYNDEPLGIGHNEFYSIEKLLSGPTNPLPPISLCPLSSPITLGNSNIILNGSFESALKCPFGVNTIKEFSTDVCNWYTIKNPALTIVGTPDYYHKCSTPADNGVPQNFHGTQAARNGGNAYAGLIAHSNGGSREYLIQELPIGRELKNKKYYAEYYVNSADVAGLGIDGLGMLLTTSKPAFASSDFRNNNSLAIVPNPNHQAKILYNGPAITDNNIWERVSGSFTAQGGEKFITIGNLKDHASSAASAQSTSRSTAPRYDSYAYYYIEDVALYELPDAGENILLSDCNTKTRFQLGRGLELPASVNPTYEWTADTEPGFTANTLFITVSPVRPTTYTLTIKAHGVTIATSNVSISGTIALGEPKQLTTIDASAARFAGNVTFSGNYNILGPLELLYGNFTMEPGTVFNVEPENGMLPKDMGLLDLSPYLTQNGGNTYPTIIMLSHGAELYINGATLKPSLCTTRGMWGGLHLANGARIYTSSGFDPDNGAFYRTVIEQAYVAVASSQGAGNQAEINSNRYGLSSTDFIKNEYGFWDLAKHQAAFPGEGIWECSFISNEVGVFMQEPNPILNPVLPGGNHTAATYANNIFENNNVGFKALANRLTLSGSTFKANNTNIDLTAGGDILNPSVITGNTIEVKGNGIGLTISLGVNVANNIINATLPQQGMGILMKHSTTAENNFLNNFGIGIYVETNLYDQVKIEKNTFTDNLTGIRFASPNPGTINGGLVPPVIACNTFTALNISNSNTIGIHIPLGVRMVKASNGMNRLGGNRSSNAPGDPNGNYFDPAIDVPVVNLNTNPADKLYYFRYKTSSMELVQNRVNANTVEVTDAPNTTADNNTCAGSNGPGVYGRMRNTKLAGTKANLEEMILLGQSYPNPASTEATLNYQLLGSPKAAELIFREAMGGKIVKIVDLNPNGKMVNVNLQGFRNGLYAYTLVVDGKPVATKMIMVEK